MRFSSADKELKRKNHFLGILITRTLGLKNGLILFMPCIAQSSAGQERSIDRRNSLSGDLPIEAQKETNRPSQGHLGLPCWRHKTSVDQSPWVYYDLARLFA